MNDEELPEEIEEEVVYPYWNLINPHAEKALYAIFLISFILLILLSFKL